MTVPFKPEVADATRVARAPLPNPYPTIGPANAPAAPGVDAALAPPTWRDRLARLLTTAQQGAEFLPSPFGDVAAAGAAVREARKGDWTMAGLSAAGALPLLPSLAPAKAAKKGITSKQAWHLRNAIAKNGGFTFDPRSGKFVSEGGYMVGGVPGQRGMAVEKLTPETLNEFVEQNADLLARDDMMFGGWYDQDSGKYFLDVSERVPDQETALRMLSERGEKAAWDLDNMTELRNPDVSEAVSAGSSPAQWTPEQLDAFGQQHGVEGLGKASETNVVTLKDGSKVNIPGGTDGRFSYYDLMTLKAQGIDPNLLPDGMHEQIHQKMLRTMTHDQQDDLQLFKGLLFGITSPNSPLTPNEFTVARLMPRSMDDIKKLGEMRGKDIPDAFGIQSGSKGGIGTRGSVDYQNVANFARLFHKNPKWFRRGADEGWDEYADRIATQVPGLGTKTSSLGAVWDDVAQANTSAVDRHMITDAWPELLKDKELMADFTPRVIASWNASGKGKPAKTLADITKQKTGMTFARDFMQGLATEPLESTYRTRKGGFGKHVTEKMKKQEWIEEPEIASTMNPYYRKILQLQDKVKPEGMSLFGTQWLRWDKVRGRIEPHEIMHPDLHRLPPMALEDVSKALKTHGDAGYKSAKLSRVRPVANPMEMAYWGLGGLLGAGAIGRDQLGPSLLSDE